MRAFCASVEEALRTEYALVLIKSGYPSDL
jgi:hypothetical protein